MLNKLLVTIVALAFGGSALASTTCTKEPKEKWQGKEAAIAKLREQGFEVTKFESKRSCYEVYAKDAKGSRYELYVDPVTIKIVKQESK